MAKAIKFNLQFGEYEKPIRNINELRDNFNIDLVLESYYNGLLQRWLLAQGETDNFEKITTISADICDNKHTLAHKLCEIINPSISQNDIIEGTYIYEFRKIEEDKLEKYATTTSNRTSIIEDYHSGYDDILSRMEENADTYQFLKVSITELFANYKLLFTLDLKAFYNRYIFDYPLVILAVLANEKMRKLLLEKFDIAEIYLDITESERKIKSFVEKFNSNTKLPHVKQCTDENYNDVHEQNKKVLLLSDRSGKNLTPFMLYTVPQLTPPFLYVPWKNLSLPQHIQKYSRTTDDYWAENLPSADKPCMIIDIQAGNKIRNFGKIMEEFDGAEVKGKFMIFNGINYKSKNKKDTLKYMEI
ncbi:MAG: hypothetical protein LBT59_21325 [Clostridiales bacterium]|jgi:hypothetical protein|nr:hypothetical protein [Clostridiales bacterium]